MKQLPLILVVSFLGSVLSGCATFAPGPLDESPFRNRALTQVENQVRVTAAVLSAEESEAVFDLPLYKKGIQPVWLEIENNTAQRIWFPALSLDPDYFAPLEVAYMHKGGFTRASKQRMDEFFHGLAMARSVPAGAVRSGFVFSQLEMGTKAFNVDIIGYDNQIRTFTFLVPVEGLPVDHREVTWNDLYADHQIVSLETSQSLKRAIEALPCCTTDAEGTRSADPINVVIVGPGENILYTLLRSGWDETAAEASYDLLARPVLLFKYQPVKSLYFFDRSQDAAFRKSRSTLNERNQLRLWLSPLRYRGQTVWVGQISRIIRRAFWEKFVIAPDVDEARFYLFQDLLYSGGILKYGYIRAAEAATLANPRKSLHDDDYVTDGLLLVVWVSDEPVPFSQIEFIQWEKPVGQRKELLLGR